jgi:hypothetical protein
MAGYAGCYELNKIKMLISASGRAIFFLSIYDLHRVLPYHALNSEFANFETPCIFPHTCIFILLPLLVFGTQMLLTYLSYLSFYQIFKMRLK